MAKRIRSLSNLFFFFFKLAFIFSEDMLTCFSFQLPTADLPDESTFEDNDIVPGGRITMRIWRQDGWGHLVAAAAKGDTMKVDAITSVNGWGLCVEKLKAYCLRSKYSYKARLRRANGGEVL